jgi:pyruvate/2-oxoacid:ferredoxin oxidoreductase beta subunit
MFVLYVDSTVVVIVIPSCEKYGDNNMKAYQQAWNANADSKIFEAMNITRDEADPAKQKAELNRLFPNQNQYKDFLKKYQNIKKLSETGSL